MKSRYVEQGELRKLREVLPAEYWLPFWVSLETGLRVGDVVKIKCKDVKEDGIHYVAEKTGKRGIAPISASLRKALNKKGKYIFPSSRNKDKHLTRQAVWSRIKRGGERAGVDVEGLSPHTMRKVFAVDTYREKGFKAVKEALQHTNAATTEIYSFSDWSTGENAEKPLTRKDLQLIIKMCIEALGDGYKLQPESESKKGKRSKSEGTGADKPAPAAEGARKPRKRVERSERVGKEK